MKRKIRIGFSLPLFILMFVANVNAQDRQGIKH